MHIHPGEDAKPDDIKAGILFLSRLRLAYHCKKYMSRIFWGIATAQFYLLISPSSIRAKAVGARREADERGSISGKRFAKRF